MTPASRVQKSELRIVVLVSLLVTIAPISAPSQEFRVDFSADPVEGFAPLTVGFSDRSQGQIDRRLWDFDFDGRPDSSEVNPLYTYTRPGHYTVNLIAIGAEGAITETKTDFITVLEGEPSTDFVDLAHRDTEGFEDRPAGLSRSNGSASEGPTTRVDPTLEGYRMDGPSPAANFAEERRPSTRAAAAGKGKDKEKKKKHRKIKLRWDANTEEAVAGYKIYYKPDSSGPPYSGRGADQGDSPITVYKDDLKNEDHPRFEFTGLSADQDYFFAIKAVDDEVPPNESDFSNEASTLDVDAGDGSGGGGCFIDTVRLSSGP